MSERSELPGDLEEQVVLGMYDRGLLLFPEGGKKLRSGRISPYYYDSRHALSLSSKLDGNGTMSYDQQREFRSALVFSYAFKMAEMRDSAAIDHIFGKAQAATSLAAVAAIEADLSYIWERVEEPGKNHGSTKLIEGDYTSGERICVTDDAATEGLSLVEKAGPLLIKADLNPVAAVLQFDREDGGVGILEKLYEVNVVTYLSKAIPILKDNKRINNRVVEAIDDYIEGLEGEDIAVSYRRLEAHTEIEEVK